MRQLLPLLFSLLVSCAGTDVSEEAYCVSSAALNFVEFDPEPELVEAISKARVAANRNISTPYGTDAVWRRNPDGKLSEISVCSPGTSELGSNCGNVVMMYIKQAEQWEATTGEITHCHKAAP